MGPSCAVENDDLSLVEAAENLIKRDYPKLDVIYTSPFPVGHYKITFGRDLKKSTGKDGSIVFIIHGYVRSEFDELCPDDWATCEDLKRMKNSAKKNSTLR